MDHWALDQSAGNNFAFASETCSSLSDKSMCSTSWLDKCNILIHFEETIQEQKKSSAPAAGLGVQITKEVENNGRLRIFKDARVEVWQVPGQQSIYPLEV